MNSHFLRFLCLGLVLSAAACVGTTPSSPSVAAKADAASDTAATVDTAGQADAAAAPDSEAPADAADSAAAVADADAALADLADLADDQTAAADSGPDGQPAEDAAETVLSDVPAADTAPDTAVGPDAAAETIADTAGDAAPDATADASADATEPPKPGLAAPCDSDEDCLGTGAGKKCNIASHSCVICLSSKDCAAGDLCQAKTCKPSKVCKSDTDCKATNQVCDKAELVCVDCYADVDCGAGKCSDHKCVAATPCKTSKECPLVCDQAKGFCADCASSNDCKDGNFCNSGTCAPKLCLGNVCAGGKSFVCSADGSGYAAGKSCDDGNACTDGDTCDAGACKPGPAKVCDDKLPCTTDSCDAKLGCQTAFNTAACDDKNPCTEVDKCVLGTCAGAAKNCDDAKTCTLDSCKDGNCVSLAQPGTCTDGNACTDGDLCGNGNCAPGKAVNCDDSNPCTDDSCDPAKGCVWLVKTGACDDGNNCTSNDTCTSGKCAGVGKQCDDGNPCTDDKCDAGTCSFVANSKPCDDKDNCTDGDVCAGGKCGGKIKVCDDGNPCTDNKCMSTGCSFPTNTAACDDGDGCTEKDVCNLGSCHGTAKSCDDSNPCTDDSCKANACVNAPNTAPCGTPGSCDVCNLGKCVTDTFKGFEDFYGGNGTDSFRGALPTAGGWLLYGTTASKGAGYDDGWVVKVDYKGAVQWEKTYGGTYYDSLRGGVVGNDGNFVLTGYKYTNSSNYQIWALKIDKDGNILWNKDFGGNYEEEGWGIAANSDGYLIAGQYRYASSSSTTQYALVYQIDETGLVKWSKDFPTGTTYAEAVAPSGDGNVYALFQGTGANNSIDMLVRKLKPGGSQIWQAVVGSPNGTDSPGDLIVGSDGNVYVSGMQYAATGNRLAIAKIDPTGTVLWTKTYGDVYTEAFAMVESGGNVVAVGRASQNSQYDGYAVAVSKTDGSVAWERKVAYNGSYNDDFFGIAAPAPGTLLLLGDAYVGNGAGSDAWLVVVNDKGKLACACDGATCDDGNGCTADACYLGLCKGKPVASGTYCKDATVPAGKCDAAGKCVTLCGNKYCDAGENNTNCPGDCTTKCGNGYCETGESFSTCPTDCKHFCDTHCGAQASSGCYCDNSCKKYGDCCDPSGSYKAGYTCSGSTCGYCN